MLDRSTNAFLSSLADESYRELAPYLTQLELSPATTVFRTGERTEWVYFPQTALLSVLTSTRDGQSVETAMIGLEGAAGVIEACGSGRALGDVVTQVDGRTMRAPSGVFRSLVARHEDLAARAWAMIEFQMVESRQSAMCNALHTVEHRLARWLLECGERCGGREKLPLTQDYLAAMLGVQRTTVNTFAALLQKAGLISYARGRVTILDPEGLERCACECRPVVKAERARLGFGVSASEPHLMAPRHGEERSLAGG